MSNLNNTSQIYSVMKGAAIYKLLNSYGWIESLSAGAGATDRTNSSINVSISLAKEGSLHVAEITSLLFQYIEILEKQKPLEWLYNEQAVVANLAFEFQRKNRSTAVCI